MVGLIALLICGLIVVGVMRRGGLAAWVGLLVGMAVFGADPRDPLGTLLAAAVGFVATRLGQSYLRERSWGAASRFRRRLAGRPVYRRHPADGHDHR